MNLIVDFLREEMKHEHGHDGLHHHDHTDGSKRMNFIMIGSGAVILLLAIVFRDLSVLSIALYFAAYFIVGGPVLLRAIRNISHGIIFDENFLMGLATVGALIIGQFGEAVSVMLFYQIGEIFQDLTLERSRKSIAGLMDIRPDFAVIKTKDGENKVNPEEVEKGQTILVRPGERIPLDGVVTAGNSTLDTSAITGESLPKDVSPGDLVYSGAINEGGLLEIQVTKPFAESTVSRILELVEEAGERKAPTEKFITKFASYYTPFVVFSAAAIAVIPPILFSEAGFGDWFRRALIFLVIACPCALVISIPLGFFGGIGAASRQGILVKGGNYLEALNSLDTVVFDKTGTLTKGVFKVTEVKSAGKLTEGEILRLAAHGESYSNHPIGKSIIEAYAESHKSMASGEDIINREIVKDYEEIAGNGIRATIEGRKLLVGNHKLVKGGPETENTGTIVFVGVDGEYAGFIRIADEIKEDSRLAVSGLRKAGIKKIVMLTGDRRAEGEKVGKQLGLDQVYAELLPQQKVEILETLEKQVEGKGKLLFAGDGINDAPVLARAHIGVAMGGLGSDAAIEAADIVLMTDEPSKLIKGIEIAGKTRRIVWQNIVFAMGVKAAVLALGALGMATMWEAVFADVGVALLAILNAMRVKA